jgi:hypothetical protein
MDFRAADFGLSGASIEYGRIVQLSHESCCDAVTCGAERIPKEGLELFGCALISGNHRSRRIETTNPHEQSRVFCGFKFV